MSDHDHNGAVHLAAFDHRASFERMIAAIDPAASGAARRLALKHLIWRGVAGSLRAQATHDTPGAGARAGVLVDPDAGSVVDEANAAGATTAIALERSGQRWLEPDRPLAELAAVLARHQPTYAKVLVRWHPADGADRRAAQAATLRELFDLASRTGTGTMLELLVPAAGRDEALAGRHPDVYRSDVLPVRLADAVWQLGSDGIVPDLWKVDGLDRAAAAQVVADAVASTSDGRARIVVLGAGGDLDQLGRWFAATAHVPGFCGFAVGRSIWWPAVERLLRGEIDEHQAIDEIGRRFRAVIATYEQATR